MSSKLIFISLIIFFNTVKAGSPISIDARGFYDLARQLCQSFASDIQMFNLHGTGLDTSGRSPTWNCRLVSLQKDQVYWCRYALDSVFLDTITGIPIGPFVVDTDWINSDNAMMIAEANGGKVFRYYNTNSLITADLISRPSPPFYTYWSIKYVDLDSISPVLDIWINAVTEEIITAVEPYRYHPIDREFNLYGNYPNPFNNSTVFHFRLHSRGTVKLKIYNLLGKEMEVVLNRVLSPNIYEIKWTARNYSSGIYFYSLSVNEATETRKFILIQ